MSKAVPFARRCSFMTQMLNTTLCFLGAAFVFVYFRRIVYAFPITIESVWQIGLAEVNHRRSKRRVEFLEAGVDAEWGNLGKRSPTRCIGSVVGYREDSDLFRKCLESYRHCAGLEIMLVGIDGNEAPDMEMANIARSVYSDNVTFIPLQEPLAALAVRTARDFALEKLEKSSAKGNVDDLLWDFDLLPAHVKEEAHQHALTQVYNKAVSILQQHSALSPKPQPFRVLCITQPHVCKKDIMFTNMVFSLALGHAYDITYLWTSDSDTWVQPSTLPRTIGCMAVDPLIGGSCSTLSIHNESDSTIASLGSAAYWSELAITRGQTAAVDAVDCQPGPCAAFRLDALEPVLLDWYTQTSLGVKTVVNEDRHLTTRLLLSNWKVTFNTEALAFTDTPTTLLRWLLQQLRWARATHIETFQYPSVYSLHGPILFVTAMRRFYGPLCIAVFTVRYVLRGDVVYGYSLFDLAARVFLCTAYNYFSSRQHVKSWAILAASQVFYQLPLPGIMFWSVLTVLEGGWGTRMRSKKEAQKEVHAGWENLGAVLAITTWMAFVAAAIGRYVMGRIAPEWIGPGMVTAAICISGLLLWGLLGKAKK